MNKTAKQNLRLGLFVILGTIFLLIGAYLIGNRQNLFGQTFKLEAVFKNVNGLQKGNNVRYSGVNVGTVNRIEMDNDTTIRVIMTIDGNMLSHIKKNAIATIGSDGLVGSMLVSIVPGEGSAPLVTSGDIISSYSRIGADDILSTLNVTNENAALLLSELLKVAASLNEGGGTLGRLLNDESWANDLKQTIKNLRETSSHANQMISQLDKSLKKIEFQQSVAGVFLADSIRGNQVKRIINDLENFSVKMESVSGTLDSLASRYSDSDGAMNYLATDTALVGNIERTMQNIEEGTAKFNENMEALKHNFLTRRYFKKLEKEKQKSEN